MSIRRFSWKAPVNPEGKPTACVVRLGAYGDMAQAMSVIYGLKAKGYHVTFLCQYPSSEIVAFDPAIDKLIVQMQDQVPIHQLGHQWLWMRHRWMGKGFDKWVNLTESAEVNLLAMAGNVKFEWPPMPRHKLMNFNYTEMQCLLAGVAYEPDFRFYPSDEDKKWRDVERERMRKAGIEKFVLWALAGSGRTHKIYPHQNVVWAHILKYYPDWGIVTVGDGGCVDLEAWGEGKARVWRTSGKWTMRQVLTMMEQADVVVGPETGLLSCAAYYPMPKVVFLSHSTVENLTRDWENTTSIWAPFTHCVGRGENEVPACHKMLGSFEGCTKSEEFETAKCAAEIKPEWVWEAVQTCMRSGQAPLWLPPKE